eukprot:TRINITY_DN102875_c0_g1_i1.p1 TRINITY_DN102875_c0_g1~~TRINITY_DN102875_c0_g1_i1.p1  ORF type:complete len:395 (-),score=66.99 TRINITY_DN102875_c0_g1_i1:34-1056(-)
MEDSGFSRSDASYWPRCSRSPARHVKSSMLSWKRQRSHSDWPDDELWEEHSSSWSKRSCCSSGWKDCSPAREDGSWEDNTGSFWPPQTLYHDLILSPGCGGGNTSPDGSTARNVLLFFHSCTHGPEDVLQFLPFIWEAGLQANELRVVAPCSPQREEFGRPGRPSHSWYDYTTDRCWRGHCPDRVEYSQYVEQRQRLLQILEDEDRRLPDGGSIIIGGLSQGASLALDVVLHAPEHIKSIAGCFCLRGMMQGETHYDLQAHKVALRSNTCPIFVYHGKADSTVPWKLAWQSYTWLEDRGFEVKYCFENDATHSCESLEEYRGVARFVRDISLSWTDNRWW